MITRSAKKITELKAKMGDIEELRKVVETIRTNMATNEKIDEFMKILAEKDAKISQLEERISFLEQSNSLLDDNESYTRRQNLRIIGIPPAELGVKETPDEVVDKVKAAIGNLNIPDLDINSAVDRAHRVGKQYGDINGKTVHPVIVRFTSWRARTAIYRKRERRGQVRFYIDLTKRRFDLRKKAEKLVENNQGVQYVFADVNNNIALKLTNGNLKFFNSEDELRTILGNI